MARVTIQFIRCYSPYNEGDKAGFDQRIADRYVRTGVARYFTTAVESPPVVKAASPEPVVVPSPPVSEPEEEEKPVVKKKKKKKAKTRKRGD